MEALRADQTEDCRGALEQLPLISVAGVRTGSRHRLGEIADAIGQASRDIGFFRVVEHGIDLALVERTYQMAERFFALQDSVKRRYYIALSTNHRGYVPFTEKGDYPDEVNRSYEAFDIGLDLPSDDPDYLAGNRLLGPNVWPDVVGFKQTVLDYYGQIAALGRLITSALEMHLGLAPGAMTDQMTKPISQLRMLHYVRQNSGIDAQSVNMGAHTDYECLTLLHTRNPGLQVMTAEDRWINVPADPHVYVVNIGDMLEAWTNGQLRSTPHRVLNLSPERFSMPYFIATNYHTMIQPFPEFLGESGQTKYEPFLAGAHLERMLVRDFPYLQSQRPTKLAKNGESVENPFEKRIFRSSS
ncbi:isopenicillin N synthase family dioxygenase [Tateyamaria sp. SN3-11]|uniref:isopenicillin N synthase family dioxygenase n=1 Tax=Tateyamaria sp. SN3-11 TaxID=3092147 RepID=UPI0039E9F759